MQLIIAADGTGRCVYGEDIDLSTLGVVEIRRASTVEPDQRGRWWADLSPVGGPRLGPFGRRSAALKAEMEWLGDHLVIAGGKQVVT